MKEICRSWSAPKSVKPYFISSVVVERRNFGKFSLLDVFPSGGYPKS